MPDRVSVASSEFIRNVGYWQNEALRRPVGITHHGRERLVLATPEEFDTRQSTGDDQADLTHALFDVETLLDNLEDAYVALSGALRVTRSNAAAEALIGRSRDLLLGDGLGGVFPQPFAAILQEKLHRVLRARKPDAFSATLNESAFAIRAFPLSDGVGVLFGNRTEQHDQRVALGVGNAACEAANRHTHAAGVKLDVFGRIKAIHDSACVWLSLDHEEIEGRRLLDLLRADQRHAVSVVLDRVMLGGAPEEIEVVLVGRDRCEVAGLLTMASIQTDFVTHGAMALLVRSGEAAAERAPMRASA